MELIKSTSDKVVSGVCGGLAKTFQIDSGIFRGLFVLGTILLGGTPVLIYLVLALLLPNDGDRFEEI
jgi:phage shock protein C